MGAKGILHPKCGERFADSERTGHCGTCCQTFYGLAAYDKHLVREGGRYWHTVPNDGVDSWWKDEKQRWHHGPRMSEEQKQQLGWSA